MAVSKVEGRPDAVFICLLRGSNRTYCRRDFSTCSFQAVGALGLQYVQQVFSIIQGLFLFLARHFGYFLHDMSLDGRITA